MTVGGKDVRVPVPEIESKECPMSVVLGNPKVDVWVSEVLGAHRIKESTGAVMYGPDSSKWPALWYDLVMLAEMENWRVEEAKDREREGPR